MGKLETWDMVGAYPICPNCNKRDVVRDAWTSWSMAEQDWLLKATFDHFQCDACGEAITPQWQVGKEFRKKRIRRLNDALRRGEGANATVVVTAGVQAMGQEFQEEVCRAVAAFTDFSADNDPFREHDFGQVMIAGEKLFFKIDYYDLKMQNLSLDPASDRITHRVLTIMLAREY